MNTLLSTELNWLVLTLLMTSLFWMPYIINRLIEQGILTALWDQFGLTSTQYEWAKRMMLAHTNAVENLVLFAPLVILIEITQLNSEITALACMIYFFARLTHFIVFTLAIPLLRVVSFLIGFGAQMILILTLMGFQLS